MRVWLAEVVWTVVIGPDLSCFVRYIGSVPVGRQWNDETRIVQLFDI